MTVSSIVGRDPWYSEVKKDALNVLKDRRSVLLRKMKMPTDFIAQIYFY